MRIATVTVGKYQKGKTFQLGVHNYLLASTVLAHISGCMIKGK